MSRVKEESAHCQGRVPDELEFVGRTTQALQDLQSTVRDQEDMIAILVQEAEAFHCRCPPHLPTVPEETADDGESEGGSRRLSVDAVGGVVTGSRLSNDEEEESLVAATLVDDVGEGEEEFDQDFLERMADAEEVARDREVGIASDLGLMEGAYQDYLEQMAEEAHLEQMRDHPSPDYSPDVSRFPTPDYELFLDLFLA